MRLELRPCPCGECPKFNAWPLFAGQDTSLAKEQAEELVRRWNSFEPEGPSLEAIQQAFYEENDD